MNCFNLPIHQNPLRTRADLETALLQILEPLKSRFSADHTGLHLGAFGAHYGSNSIRMEAYSRLLWGLAPLWSQGGAAEYFDLFRDGLVNGTNPNHPEYWGEVFDFDQKIVEMAAISLNLMLNGDRLALSEQETQNLHRWLGSVNGKDLPKNNWFFFRVLVNSAFRLRGWSYDASQLESDLARLDSYYLGDGWYSDGLTNQIDYYIPFGMHYYGLVYAGTMKQLDPERSRLYLARAQAFAPDFLFWFTNQGVAVPFGRSLTYRFAQSAFFSALAFAGEEALPWGVIKNRVLSNLRDWFSKPVFTPDGILSVGYGYPNLCISENYNAPGSPYWSLKTFLVLALDASHPFWTAEETVPALPAKKLLPHARMLALRDEKQVQLFVAAQSCNQLGQCAAKYEKLVYASDFGFSVSRGDSLEEGAFDCCLAVSEKGEERYRMQRGYISYHLEDHSLFREFSPLRGVTVKVKVTPDFPAHTRYYTIITDRTIDIADGGFAIPSEWNGRMFTPDMVEQDAHSITAQFPWGYSGIRCVLGGGQPVLVKAFPNTNLLHPITHIPTIRLRLEAGSHELVTIVSGQLIHAEEGFT